MDGDKCLGFIRPFIGAHLVGSWHLLQSFMAMLTWQYLPGLSIYLWILSVFPLMVWMVFITSDSARLRRLLYRSYVCAVIVSCTFGCIGPWVLKAGFWGNNCLEFIINGQSGNLKEVDRCTNWHLTMLFITLLRLPFQINIIYMFRSYHLEQAHEYQIVK